MSLLDGMAPACCRWHVGFLSKDIDLKINLESNVHIDLPNQDIIIHGVKHGL